MASHSAASAEECWPGPPAWPRHPGIAGPRQVSPAGQASEEIRGLAERWSAIEHAFLRVFEGFALPLVLAALHQPSRELLLVLRPLRALGDVANPGPALLGVKLGLLVIARLGVVLGVLASLSAPLRRGSASARRVELARHRIELL